MKAFILIAALGGLLTAGQIPDRAPGGDDTPRLSDVEIAHIAVTASNVDIRAAHLALAISTDPEVRQFAQTMINDHGAVNDRAIALSGELGITPLDNEVSQSLMAAWDAALDELSPLRGRAFDRAYSAHEAAYHASVADAVVNTLIPNAQNAKLKALLESAVPIFTGHLEYARTMAAEFAGS